MAACTPQAHAPAPPGTGDCLTCDNPRCSGTTSPTSATPGRCRKWPIEGATVCRTHGGSAPQVRAAAEARVAARQAVLAVETFGLPREVDPHSALLEELHRAAGAVQWLGAVVADLERSEVTWGLVKETRGTQLEKGTDNGTTRAAAVNVWVRLWQEERTTLARVAKTCIDVGIEERKVRLAEAAGQQLASVVRAVLDRLELTDEQRSRALVVVPEEFRRLGDTGPGEVIA